MNEHVTDTLRSAVSRHRVAHAYLFSASSTFASIVVAWQLAKALNCPFPSRGEACSVCATCSGFRRNAGFIEIKWEASVASIRCFVTRPGQWTVYVLPHVDDLTHEASDALLALLEEPPEKVVIVLESSAPQQVMTAIRARVQHFAFEDEV